MTFLQHIEQSEGLLRAELMRKADLCAVALFEARRISAAAMFGELYAQLVTRIAAMLDDLDETLLALDHRRDRAGYERVVALHAGFEELEARRAQLGT
jgi:hypothetical protein